MKKRIRKEILQLRLAMDKNEVALKSEIICRRIEELSVFKEAQTIMAYLPFRNEVDCSYLLSQIWSQGKNAVVPVCEPQTTSLIPSLLKQMEDTAPGTWGILEPKPDCFHPLKAQDIDLVIVPGVAFDLQGNRLG
ncbi:MAG: 5-formyltetrahydrofolate cyclo-ligase, partial [Clostridia bacterium]|nr:5-formyltetrahydrofolate cyclo-ligase [Clostridia bacterium]